MRRHPTPPWGRDRDAAARDAPSSLTGYPRDPNGLAAGAIPSVRGRPDVDDVAALVHGQPQLRRGPVGAQHPHAVLAARPVENLERGHVCSPRAGSRALTEPGAVTLFSVSQLCPEGWAWGRTLQSASPEAGPREGHVGGWAGSWAGLAPSPAWGTRD